MLAMMSVIVENVFSNVLYTTGGGPQSSLGLG